MNKPQELGANVLALSWGNFSGSQSIAFSPDGQRFCCGTNSETGHVFYLTVWDVETGKCGAYTAVLRNVVLPKCESIRNNVKRYSVVDPGYFEGGGVAAGTLGLQNQWGMPPKCCNLKTGTQTKPVIPEILAMSQSRNYNDEPAKRVCHNIYNLFLFCFFCFFHDLLLQKGG